MEDTAVSKMKIWKPNMIVRTTLKKDGAPNMLDLDLNSQVKLYTGKQWIL